MMNDVKMAVYLMAVLCGTVFANTAPVVSNVNVSQRTDGSGVVDIYYTLSDADNDRCTVSIEISDDGGSSWTVTATSLSGDIGENISCGNRHITWNSKTDLPGAYGTNYRIKVIADDGIVDIIPITWVSIADPGFNGYMSKYETTNAQYCQYLNAALATEDIRIQSSDVYGNSGPYSGRIYYDMDDAHAQISYSGGVFFVEIRDGYSMANHPAVEVSWYGATAFCNYYGYRLPTASEWRAVADYDGSYTYGCGTTISHSKANYDNDNPLDLSSYPYTSPVDYYPSYGYGMNDMAGNAREWTSTPRNTYYRILRSGSWYTDDNYQPVAHQSYFTPDITYYGRVGFRVCR